MVTLQPPALEVRITIAGIAADAPVPGRVLLQALAFALSWPSPPWEADVRLELERASQEEKECRQFLKIARDDEKQGARQGLFYAREALQVAQSALEGRALQLKDIWSDARQAMARLQAVGVPVSTWSPMGQKLIDAWTAEIMPASETEIQATETFTLPPSAPTSGGGSVLPATTPATP
jgi:hypothetical protein